MTQDQGTMNNAGASVDVPANESFNTEALQGSMQQILSENLGRYVVCEFLIGTQTTEERQGYLYSVGISFIVLNDVLNDVYVVCDIFSIKFVTFLQLEDYPNVDRGAQTETVPTQGRVALPASTLQGAPAGAGARQARQAAFNYAKRKSKGRL